MRQLVLAAGLVCAFSSVTSSVQANDFGFPFFPFGFYQPYGATYGTSIDKPPYFATNPPVYYGTRYARPYGISPFAAPPMVGAPAGYQGAPAATFYRKPGMTNLASNPFVCEADAKPSNTKFVAGAVRTNPFVEDSERIASRD